MMTIRSLIATLALVAASLLTAAPGTDAFARSTSQSSLAATRLMASASSSTAPQVLETHEIVGCFGRLADKQFVLSAENVQGTAASGYEFGVLESGRPKWLCTYAERTGKTQGGGAETTHVPNWCQRLFPDAGGATITRAKLREILGDESTRFEMPLGAPPGAKQRAADPELFGEEANAAAVDALWNLLGGGDDDGAPLSKDAAGASLRAAAAEFGSQGDSMTYAAFEKALRHRGSEA